MGNNNKLKDELREYLLSEECDLIYIVNYINSYNDELEHLQVYNMEEFDELMSGLTPWEIVRSAYFGEFNPTNDYFRYNGYGNLESMNEWEILSNIKDYINDVINAIMNTPYQYLPDEITDIIDNHEE